MKNNELLELELLQALQQESEKEHWILNEVPHDFLFTATTQSGETVKRTMSEIVNNSTITTLCVDELLTAVKLKRAQNG
jgi:hypothetical protein